ncbi:hypothetical protein HRI_002227800 [Hibiscus trionum]|uniref:Uncharacterized protein n=1 Tax=Hibiscus trionum TaxID=183268 RepID=A0A9W7I112_HIBTR|nr:hypothetical protein HRI_002227800 [Hibiscus trionum]
MKQTCLYLTILVLVFCTSLNPSTAVSTETNISDDNELEFLMDSHFGRILQGGGSVTGKILSSGQRTTNCGRGNPYDSCLPNPSRPSTPQNCGTYTHVIGR